MTDIVKAVILGIVEGITEFLPISSTGHLIILNRSIHFDNPFTQHFDIAIQLGAILAVLVMYRQFFLDFFRPSVPFRVRTHRFVLWVIVTIPAGIVGVLFHSVIKRDLFKPSVVAWGLITGAVLMIIAEFILKKRAKKRLFYMQTIDDISLKQSFFIGCCQAFALWPGMSRSACSIIGGVSSGLPYTTAAQFSFLAAVPIMILATGADMIHGFSSLTMAHCQLLGIGFFTAFLVALLSVSAFISLLNKIHLWPFAVYRIFLGFCVIYGY